MKPQEQTYSKSRRLKNQIKAVVTNPYNVIVLIAIVLLIYLIILPLDYLFLYLQMILQPFCQFFLSE